jgi:hypothetical protein
MIEQSIFLITSSLHKLKQIQNKKIIMLLVILCFILTCFENFWSWNVLVWDGSDLKRHRNLSLCIILQSEKKNTWWIEEFSWDQSL